MSVPVALPAGSQSSKTRRRTLHLYIALLMLGIAGILALGAVNPRWFGLCVSPNGLAFGIKNGCFIYSYGDLIPGSTWECRMGWNPQYFPEPWVWYRKYSAGAWSTGVRLGIPTAALSCWSVIAIWFFWRARLEPGTCRYCGYHLTGLFKGNRCPECGRFSI